MPIQLISRMRISMEPIWLGLGLLLLFAGAVGAQQDEFAEKRRRMVETQIRAREVKDPKVLDAMSRVPRHLFVPAAFQAQAYDDYPLPIGSDQTISQPYIVALMTSLLDLHGGERVLEIGTGSGYQAAVLSRIAARVYTIEILPDLGERARRELAELGYTNVESRIGDGWA